MTTNLESDTFDRLKRLAREAAGHSYSPYSRFRVGAAVRSASGAVYSGCNVENASFGLTQCAERAALTAAVSAGEAPGSLVELVLYIPGETAHPPCGACRQVMRELMSEDSRVVSCCDTDEIRVWSAADYLPDPFTPESLTG
jgi:cytidine deaminase